MRTEILPACRTAVGTFNFTAMVTDAAGKTASGNFSVSVVAGSNFDGPAELPIATVPSAMSDTPAPGSVIKVNAGGDLQSALNNAQCGDTIHCRPAQPLRAFQLSGEELRQQPLDHCSHQLSRQRTASRRTALNALLCRSRFAAGTSAV